jgi:hypothetical protein
LQKFYNELYGGSYTFFIIQDMWQHTCQAYPDSCGFPHSFTEKANLAHRVNAGSILCGQPDKI